MTYRTAIKINWRETPPSPRHLVERARLVIRRKCKRCGDRARRHTLW